MKNILIIGATSAIAEATARHFAREKSNLFLVARNEERLTALAHDLSIRGAAQVGHATLDVNDFDRHQQVIDQAVAAMGGIDIALIAHGTLGDQKACEQDVDLTLQELRTNTLSVIALLTRLANVFESRRSGTIAVISSVAGDRGRQSNYIYGTAKGAVTIFLQGLRNRLYKSGVNVVTIKPGFVDTPMTAAFPKGPLWAKPEQIAEGIARAIEARKTVVYLPGFWRMIMLIIRSIPEPLFRRLSL